MIATTITPPKALGQKSVKFRFEQFIASERFLPILACFVLFFHALGYDMLGIAFMMGYLMLVFLTDTPLRAAIPGLCMLIMVAGLRQGFYRRPYANPDYYLDNIAFLITIASMLIASIAFGITKRYLKENKNNKNKTFAKNKFTTSAATIGLVAVSTSFILGGIFSEEFSALTILLGLLFAGMFLAFFAFGKITTKKIDFNYLAKVFITISLVVSIQLVRVYILRDLFALGRYEGIVAKNNMSVGWAHSNSIGMVIALGIPFSGYYVATEKNPLPAIAILLLQNFAVLLSLSRTMVFIAASFTLFIFIYALFKQKKKTKLILAVTLLAIIATFCVVFIFLFDSIRINFNFFFQAGFSDTYRMQFYYLRAWNVFRQNPLFGAGAAYGTNPDRPDRWIFFAHNSILQFLMWSGIVGLFAFLLHIVLLIKSTFKKGTEKRMFLFFVALFVLGNSMLEVFLFMPPTLIFYMIIIAAIDNDALENGGFGRVEIDLDRELKKVDLF